MISFKRLLAGPIVVAVLVAGCSSGAATPTAAAPGGPAAGSATVMTATAGGKTVLVAGSNGMTVYKFDNDVANSGKSACTAGCLTKWPALTVPAGTTPTAGAGVTGTLATITRTDDGTLQVTYNGLPLYFYQGDKAPGDTNGNYPGWSSITP